MRELEEMLVALNLVMVFSDVIHLHINFATYLCLFVGIWGTLNLLGGKK